MNQIKLNLKKRVDKSYNIIIDQEAISLLPDWLKKNKIGKKYVIITDSTVEKLFGKKLLYILKKNKIMADLISFEKGEKSKNLQTVEGLAEKMIKKGFDRHDAIIALGGGVVGDISGFLASVYMRGMPYIQIPTTLMAMVDSAIGGKTGVDLPSGKNLIGTITQPKGVIINLDYLKKLPDKQIRNGLAEIIKYGVIEDKKLFEYLEKNMEKILSRDTEALKHIVKSSVKIKVRVVEEDEKEKGKRIILNYGHTYGHALEKLSGYKLLHGYAISIGMVIANKIAVQNKIMKKEDADRVKKLLSSADLPITTMKKPTKKDISTDKKREGNYVKMVVPKQIGKVTIYKQPCQ